MINSHKNDIFISEIIFKIKESYFYLYVLFSLGEGLFENFPKNITRYKGRGENKSYVFIIRLSLSMKLQIWLLFYTVVDNIRPILIQNTNGNLH